LSQLAIVGAGSWGTALAIVLGPRFGRVRLWVYEADLAERIASNRENDVYLAGFRVPDNVEPVNDMAAALEDAEIVLVVAPSHLLRGVCERMLPYLHPGVALVSATKGIENGSLMRMTEVIGDVVGARFEPRTAVISGPTFAREVARGDPTALVVAAVDAELAEEIQSAFSSPTFRLYTSPDPVGVEIAGAIKNVVAIGAGVAVGLGLGSNASAALITRGLAEMIRLAVAMGGRPQTLAGLAGLGDLVLTCGGELSRNRTVGLQLAAGRGVEEIVNSMRMVAEGIKTTAAAVELASRHRVEMPISSQMYEMLHFGVPPREALRRLLERSLKRE
jgi:glycerol-3-phosphate dehydrogenase (NAD(P)+)